MQVICFFHFGLLILAICIISLYWNDTKTISNLFIVESTPGNKKKITKDREFSSL